MARNAHPEVTRNRILDAAQKLFSERGYEHTSIQDIVDRLGNLSKGAIYHHFPSKKAILEAVNQRDNAQQDEARDRIVARTDLNGMDKLRETLRWNITNTAHMQLVAELAPHLDDPVTFAENIHVWSSEVPGKFLPIIEEGIEDGSIPTAYPRELAELMGLLLNYWMITRYFPATRAQLKHRIECLAVMFRALNAPVLDDELVELLTDALATYNGLDREAAATGDGACRTAADSAAAAAAEHTVEPEHTMAAS